VRIQPSQAKNKLFIGGIPHELSREGMQAVLEPRVKGEPVIRDVWVWAVGLARRVGWP